MTGGRGVILQELDVREKLLAICVVGSAGVLLEGPGKAGKEFNLTLAGKELSSYVSKRARKGKLLLTKAKVANLSPIRAVA
jgi:topoisomerase-4 subunit A